MTSNIIPLTPKARNDMERIAEAVKPTSITEEQKALQEQAERARSLN